LLILTLIFLNKPEVLKLVQKIKLETAEEDEFIKNLLAVDFNNRCDESKYK